MSTAEPTPRAPDLAAGNAALAKSQEVMRPIIARQDYFRRLFSGRVDAAIAAKKEGKDAR